jgi:BCD family chlorophyll transporter-like MFS transporter
MSEQPPNLSVARNLKIALFHLGSGMADILATGTWNRIMISDLGFSATPIGLLLSLRYFLAPLGVWAGRMSDRRTVAGYRRLFWVWSGRLLMVVSMVALGLATASLARGAAADVLMWVVISLSLLLFSLGYSLSGGTFLALVYDRAPEHQRGRAVGIVWTFLLLGFTVGGALFAILLPKGEETTARLDFTPETLQTLFIVAALVMGALWFVSLFGEEKRYSTAVAGHDEHEPASSLRADLKLALSNRQTRFFFWYLALSMLFAFSQDLILEPFAGDVFGMEVRVTTRFAMYWGSMSILGTVVFLWLSRRYKRLNNTRMSYIGVGLLALTFAVFGLSALAGIRGLVTPGLILLGLGLGVWNVGTLGLMMDMSPFGRAGTFLGFWTMVVTFARGLGVSGGGVVRDVALQLTGNLSLSYGAVFILGVFGLLAALWVLSRVNVAAFKSAYADQQPADSATILAGAMD